MAQGGPPDPQRRTLLRTMVLLGAAVASTVTARLLFGRTQPSADQPTSASSVPSPSETPATTTTSEPQTTSTDLTTTTTPEPVQVEVISKVGWGARQTGEFRNHEPVQLTYHHTASGGSDPAGAPDRISGYQRYHQDQGWPDVAYHFLIDQAGRIYEGRPVDAPGDTFTEYDPTGHFLPCLDGNFDVGAPSARSVEALVLILAWAAQTYRIDPATLAGHRDYASTTCPGSFAYELRDDIADRITSLMEDGRPIELAFTDTIPEPSPSTGSTSGN